MSGPSPRLTVHRADTFCNNKVRFFFKVIIVVAAIWEQR
jgi:hypothetical protein